MKQSFGGQKWKSKGVDNEGIPFSKVHRAKCFLCGLFKINYISKCSEELENVGIKDDRQSTEGKKKCSHIRNRRGVSRRE